VSVCEIKNEPVGIWVRVSAGGQDEANQLPDILRYCADRGYKIERRYELHGRSASKGQHQGKLDEMLEDMRRGAIKVLVCWWSDRIERRGPEALFRLLRLTRDAGGRIESTHEPLLGWGDISGEAMTELNAVMAHYESIKIAERIKKGHDRIKANGATSSRVPWVTTPKVLSTTG
jgi:DNA invertase Pin-like site-specific DNA recombinase